MAGYDGYSKSNNAVAAEDEGRFPITRAARIVASETGITIKKAREILMENDIEVLMSRVLNHAEERRVDIRHRRVMNRFRAKERVEVRVDKERGMMLAAKQAACPHANARVIKRTLPGGIVDKIQTFETGDTIKIEPIGGGGTDFRPVFKYIEESGDSPACLIYLTDLDGDFPDQEPDFPVLWINTSRKDYYQRRTAPFGETILMHPRG